MPERVIVTGGAGFIGSNIVRGLNARGVTDVIVVDDLQQGNKFCNLVDLKISDYFDRREFYKRFADGYFGNVEAIFHEGACSDTMEHDGAFMMDVNYRCSRDLLEACQKNGTRLLYASSAATYGKGQTFIEHPDNEHPLNVYGYSKLLMDQVVRQVANVKSQIVGFRYFNVYGPNEQHKGRMASVAFHNYNQFKEDKTVKLFGAYLDCGDGEHTRDFIYIDDVVAVNLWFYDHPEKSGIFNLGSGYAQPFNDIALSVVNTFRNIVGEAPLDLASCVKSGLIQYIDFPESLVGKYQNFTQANLSKLRAIGCDYQFHTVQTGVAKYIRHLMKVNS